MLLFSLGIALAQDDDDDAPAPTPAPAEVAAPAPSGMTVKSLAGKWWFTSQVDGKESVGWACKGTPGSILFDDETLVVSAGAEPIGAAIRKSTPKGEGMAFVTSIEACGGREMSARWVDAAHKVVEFTRCEGSPRVVRAVRDVASGVPVMRQCCDAAGKSTGWTPSETPCRAGEGQKPTPLQR